MPLAHLAAFREAAYRLFSQTLLYPKQERLAALTAAIDELWEERAAIARFAFFGRWSELLRYLKHLPQHDLSGIQASYVSMFAANATGVPCPPYESVYREQSGQPTGWLLAQVEREYAAAGFALSPTLGELPDHVAVEMEFMALLCGREAQAWEDRNPAQAAAALQTQHRFLRRHLAPWFREFADRVDDADRTGLYATVSRCAGDFMSYDRDLVQALLETAPTEGATFSTDEDLAGLESAAPPHQRPK